MEEETKLKKKIIWSAITIVVVLGLGILYTVLIVSLIKNDLGENFELVGWKHLLAILLFAILFTALCSLCCFLLYLVKTRKKTVAEATQITYIDDLTGLPTKSRHKEEMVPILKRAKGMYAYAICDVSDFKFVNETYGYEYGNMALKHIASVFRKSLRKNELVSRTSGDHFGILLQYETVPELVERLQQMLGEAAQFPSDKDGNAYKAVFTCGVYLIQGDEDPNKIRARATVARKSLKKALATQIGLYSEEDHNKELLTKELENELKSALRNNEFIVYFQPKYDITSERIIGAEALVRWEHPQRGLLSPGIFIPLCEENGFVREIDFYVFDIVCSKLKEWVEKGKQLITISVNFSRLHLEDSNFVERLVEMANSHGIPPKYLEIELTETAVYSEMDTLLTAMHQIKEAGFGLSMDDFGSGYSSLHLLREMPVDVLKLDKGFLDDCSGEETTREKRIISHVISMAKDLEIAVLAEGVETAQQKDFLKNTNCDMIQGYYYAKPMPAENFEYYLA